MTSPTDLLRHFEPYSAGLFVIVSINPSASIAPLQDGDADEAAGKMMTKKYLAWIVHHALETHYDKPMYGLGLFIVSRRPQSDDGLLGPNEIRISGNIPWTNCLQLCRQPLMFSIGTEYKENPSNATLPRTVTTRIFQQMKEEANRVEAALRLVESKHQPEVQGERGSVPHIVQSGEELLETIEFASNPTASESDDESFLGTSLTDVGTAPPIVDIWLDLKSTSDIGEPEELLKELEELEQIEKVAKERIEADVKASIAQKRARQPKWVRKAMQSGGKGLDDAGSLCDFAGPSAFSVMGKNNIERDAKRTSQPSAPSRLLRSGFRFADISRMPIDAILHIIRRQSNNAQSEDSAV